MAYGCNSMIICIPFFFLLFIACIGEALPLEKNSFTRANQTFQANNYPKKFKMIRAYLNKINKPAVKTIQSPDGDIIDCVLFHQQPAFDHPLLKDYKPLHPPKALNKSDNVLKGFQLWSMSGETCPEGTVAIRRTTEQDILRAGSLRQFKRTVIRYQEAADGVEWALGHVEGGKYTQASAVFNIWSPRISDKQEFSLAQIWVGAATNDNDVNTLQAGWMASPTLFGDSKPRTFTYWTADSSKSTGCFNLLCSGYVHTNPRIAIGATITPISQYGGKQFELYFEIRQEPKANRWVLAIQSDIEVGYWPMSLFTHLNHGPALKLQYGGLVRNKKTNGVHTQTAMGSGHFAQEGFKKAAYVQSIKMADQSNGGIPYSVGLIQTEAKSPNCYNVQFGNDRGRWGSYIFYGGPGKNANCP